MKATFMTLMFITSSVAVTCFEKGECLNSFILDVAETESPQQCLAQCKQTPGCTWFTYNPSFPYCELLSNCLTLSESSCPECLSGEAGCSAYKCNIPGRCQVSHKYLCWFNVSSYSLIVFQGYGIDIVTTSTASKCLLTCKETDQCNWYSHNLPTQTCITFKTCDAIDVEDTEYTSGQVECPDQHQSYSKRKKYQTFSLRRNAIDSFHFWLNSGVFLANFPCELTIDFKDFLDTLKSSALAIGCFNLFYRKKTLFLANFI